MAHFGDARVNNHSRASKVILTWLPKTPTEQAEDTWSGPNHTAATFGETPKRKTWAVADISWPINATLKPSRDTLKTFIQAPAVVPIDPRSNVTRRPFDEYHRVMRYLTRGRWQRYPFIHNPRARKDERNVCHHKNKWRQVNLLAADAVIPARACG